MRDYRDEDHLEEWRRQSVDDREYLERQQMLSCVDCTQCIYRSERGECVCLTSVYFGEEVDKRNVCEEWEYDGED